MRVIDDQKMIAAAVERGLKEDETIDQLYEFIRGLFNLEDLYLIEPNQIAQIIGDQSTELSDLIAQAAPLLNHLISSEAPNHFGYFKCASIISLVRSKQLSFNIFQEFMSNRDEALQTMEVAQSAENNRLKLKYEVPIASL